MGKRYYWLKLPEDFFRQKPIKKLRRIAGGDTYTIIYLKMLLVSLKNEGKLFFDGVEENFTEEIALELDEEEENVKVTVQFLMAQGLLQLIDESEYELTECSRMVGSESASAERMRRLRDKKTSQCDIGVTQQLHLSDVEIDKEIENKYICSEVNSGQPQPKAEIEPVADSRTKVEIEPSCSKAELKVETEPAQADVFIKLPLINGDDYLVTKEYVKELKELYPEMEVKSIRGNLQTRLQKLDNGEYSGLILAAAGLKRLGLENRICRYFSEDEILPAAGQGILAVQGRQDLTYDYLEGYRDEKAWFAGSAERAFVKYLNGGCSSPVAAFGVVEGDELFLRGLYYRECDGRYFKDSIRGPKAEAEKLGRDLAKRMQDMYDNIKTGGTSL